MKTLTKIGSIASGAVMIGAAFAGAASAAFDSTGIDAGFFYDADFNPMVQIVVGEKGLASDSVAAGNIAAVIGNLAYSSSSSTVGGGAEASGQVILGVSAQGATGKYVQASTTGDLIELDVNPANGKADFYDDNEGLLFLNESQLYERGEFVSYSLACDQQTRTEAGILKEGTYNNVHCLFCQTLCLEQLENPSHDLEEKISVNYGTMNWYEDGLRSDDSEALKLEIESKSIAYIVDAGEVPFTKITDTTANAETIDFEWRGKFILFGEEYYVKDIDGTDKMYLAKGKILDDVSSEGYTSEYMGYKFKVDHLIYSAEYQVAGILLDVEKPDGTVVQTQISKMANGVVDDIEVAGVYAEEADAVATASIIVYDTSTNVILEDGKDLEFGGEQKKYWRVQFATESASASTSAFRNDLDTDEYDGTYGTILHNISITYRHDIVLEEGESLEFPSTYLFTFNGYRTNDYRESPCSGAGEGLITLGKDDKYKMLLGFTGDDGQRYEDIRMDQGAFVEGDEFIVNGKIYEYDDAEEQSDDVTMRITLKDILNGGKNNYDLAAVTSPSTILLTTTAFETQYDNDDEIELKPDTNNNYTDVFWGPGPNSVPMLYDGGDLYIVPGTTSSTINGTRIGVHQDQVGPSRLDDFEINGHSLEMWVLNENGTTDLNNDVSGAARIGELDDTLVIVKNEEDEYAIIDMYDRNFNDTEGDTYYDQSVKVTGQTVTASSALTAPNTEAKLDDDRDTLLILPKGGDRVTVDYGGDFEVKAVEICHPQEVVYATTFIGTGEEATLMESIITKEDEGKEKTAGCCTYTVKEFGVSTSATSTEVASVSVKPIVGNLVVPEVSADTTKNLVIVGGPAVNGLTTVTAAEIQAASQNYIVKKDGKKLIVAGWTAADTIDGGNALIAWLKDNVHA